MAKFQVGHKFATGRPKGALNKRTVEFRQVLEKHNFCPATAMLDIYKIAMERFLQELELQGDKSSFVESDAPKYLKIAADKASELASYTYPKLKAIEQTKGEITDSMTPEQKLEAMKHAVQMLELQISQKNGTGTS